MSSLCPWSPSLSPLCVAASIILLCYFLCFCFAPQLALSSFSAAAAAAASSAAVARRVAFPSARWSVSSSQQASESVSEQERARGWRKEGADAGVAVLARGALQTDRRALFPPQLASLSRLTRLMSNWRSNTAAAAAGHASQPSRSRGSSGHTTEDDADAEMSAEEVAAQVKAERMAADPLAQELQPKPVKKEIQDAFVSKLEAGGLSAASATTSSRREQGARRERASKSRREERRSRSLAAAPVSTCSLFAFASRLECHCRAASLVARRSGELRSSRGSGDGALVVHGGEAGGGATNIRQGGRQTRAGAESTRRSANTGADAQDCHR